MALQQLSPEQISQWSRAQKDQWWLDTIYRADMPQLTLRSAVTGFLLGGILSATALYIGGKTGITIGVGLTSVILAFAMFRLLENAGITRNFSILENNCSQSIATAAGFMVTPMISALSAYMMVTGRLIPWWQMLIWMVINSILGVLVAFPLKRRFINEEQLPFPEGRASGVVLDALYNGDPASGMYKARLLAFSSAVSATYQVMISDGWMKLIEFKILRMDQWMGLKEVWKIHEKLDHYYYAAAVQYDLWLPKILGTSFQTLGLRLSLDGAMLGVGGLMGIRIASSVLLGTILNFVLLAPWMIQRGDIAARLAPNGKTVAVSRVEIVNQWGLWWAVALMVTASILSIAMKPELFRGLFKPRASVNHTQSELAAVKDVLAHIELPLMVSYIGIPVFSILAVWVTHIFFAVPWTLALVSIPLILVLAMICANAMALTSWTPVSTMAKITQFSMGAIDSTNPASNLIPAGVTAEVASNAANLLSDIKPGYMLGASPRKQALGHLIGIFSGALACIPLYYLLFLPPDANGVRSAESIVSEQFPMPNAMQWKGVSEMIAKGISSLPQSALIAMAVAVMAAVLLEVWNYVAKKRHHGQAPLSAVAIGLGVVLPPDSCLTLWLGAAIFWWMGRRHQSASSRGHEFWVQGCEPVCAGLITGAALIGIGNALINVML